MMLLMCVIAVAVAVEFDFQQSIDVCESTALSLCKAVVDSILSNSIDELSSLLLLLLLLLLLHDCRLHQSLLNPSAVRC
jgi:hypothetical protein